MLRTAKIHTSGPLHEHVLVLNENVIVICVYCLNRCIENLTLHYYKYDNSISISCAITNQLKEGSATSIGK